jgi:hypothetical protein
MAGKKYEQYVIKNVLEKGHWVDRQSVIANFNNLKAPCTIMHDYITEPVLMSRNLRNPEWKEPHAHPFHEFFCFIGGNLLDISEFDAEIEFHIGEESEINIINTTSIVHIPPGLFHGPINFKRVDKPIIVSFIALTGVYSSIELEK